jgi:surface antigen
MAQNARSYALENNKINSQAVWKNPDSGNSGVIYPTKTYSLGDQPCREFTQEINIGGKIHTGYGKACRMADGSWDIQ